MFSKLYELNQQFNFTNSLLNQNFICIIQNLKNQYSIFLPQQNLSQTVSPINSMQTELFLDSAVKIRFEGNFLEYELFEAEIYAWLEKKSIIPTTEPYYCVLQTNNEFDFMVFDVYIGT